MRVSGNRRPRGGRSGSGGGRSGSSGGRSGSNNNRRSNGSNRSYDSNGPDGKIRGSASQVYDKYVTLARDAQTSGDPVAAENYYQHAEHYFRIMLANNLVKQDRNTEQPAQEETATEATENTEATESTDENQEAAVTDLSEETPVSTEGEKETASAEESTSEEGEPLQLDLGSGSEEDVTEEKPKTKRRVSRTRGLRRRANRRSEDGSKEETQSAE